MTPTGNPDAGMNHILVTGGTGFLGAYILRRLILDGFTVTAIKRKDSALPNFIDPEIIQKVIWLEGDVLDIGSLEDAMENVDAVIHSAAVVSFHKVDRQKMYATNIKGTANVVNIAIEKGIKKMVHVSSVAALGRTKKDETVDENKTWTISRNNTHYAITKQKAEMEMWRGMAEGLHGVIVNPSTILGYGNWNNSSCAIFKNAWQEFPWYTNGVNGFVYVEDVANATVQLLKSDISMERFIINGDNWSFKEVLTSMATSFGKNPPSRKASRLLGSLAWRFEKIKSLFTGQKPLLSRESAKIAQSKTRFNNSKITGALPAFQFTPLEEAIKLSCKRYLKEHSR